MADKAMMQLKRAEKTFVKEKTEKMKRMFRKEKLKACFVAERKAEYGMVETANV